MKIYSWNMLCRNTELDRAFEFIRDADFDIFCLQEVPENFLKQLKTLPYYISFRSERELLYSWGTVHNFVVALSKYPIITQGEISFPEYWSSLPLRTHLFVTLMPSQLFTKIRNRSALYTDVLIHNVPVRVFNLHLILAQPAWRLKEFETAMLKRDPSRPTIVCGDFNTIESPLMAILNWFLGGSPADVLFYRRERTRIEKHFVEHALLNPLRGKMTHALAGSQLDHILVSHSFTIKSAEVISDCHGSDHHPIRVEIE